MQRGTMAAMNPTESMRLDKWLWCARFFKTRSLAADAIDQGRVQVNGLRAKPARDLRCGDSVVLRHGAVARTIEVRALSGQRGPAPVAQKLYSETPESIAAREQAAEQRRLAPEPASTLVDGRPTKRDRRDMDRARGLGDRWSATAED